MTSPSWPAVNARRLAQHGLARPFPSGTAVAEVAAAVSGVHAQVLSAAEVSAALRVERATRDDVRRALWEDRTLVKTFGPRGTVHLLPAADLGRWMAALGALPWRSAFPDGVRLTDDETRTVVAAIGEALRGRDLTVDELTEAIGDLAGAWAAEPVMPAFQTLWPRWRQVTDRAAYAGVLCYGPDRARKVTYARPPDADPVEPDAAVAWAIEQYLRSYGPATPASFAPWFGSTPAWAAERMAAHPILVRVEPEGMQPEAWDRLARTPLYLDQTRTSLEFDRAEVEACLRRDTGASSAPGRPLSRRSSSFQCMAGLFQPISAPLR